MKPSQAAISLIKSFESFRSRPYLDTGNVPTIGYGATIYPDGRKETVVETGGEAVTVSDEEILAAIPQLARATGVFAEPAAACAWHRARARASVASRT